MITIRGGIMLAMHLCILNVCVCVVLCIQWCRWRAMQSIFGFWFFICFGNRAQQNKGLVCHAFLREKKYTKNRERKRNNASQKDWGCGKFKNWAAIASFFFSLFLLLTLHCIEITFYVAVLHEKNAGTHRLILLNISVDGIMIGMYSNIPSLVCVYIRHSFLLLLRLKAWALKFFN